MSRVTIFSELNVNNDSAEEKKSISDTYTQEEQALCIDEEPELLEDGDYSGSASNKEDSKTDRD